MIAIELEMPQKDYYMDDKSNYEIEEKYVKYMSESLMIKYQKAIENNEWEIRLIAESRMKMRYNSLREHKHGKKY